MKKVVIACLFVTLVGCTKPEEVKVIAEYFVTNATDKKIILSITETGNIGETELLTDTLAVGERAKVLVLQKSIGALILPENAFVRFVAYSQRKDPKTIVYSGVRDEDWIYEGPTREGHLVYNLGIYH
jgi:hypothetical protein